MDTLTHIVSGQQGQIEPWYAVYTRYQHERSVATILAGKGFQVFLPTYRILRRWSDRKKEISLPLFPGYVFFVDRVGMRIQVLSTPGIHSIVASGKTPAAIPDDEIAAIRRAVESPARVLPHPFLRSGDRVRIRSGPLAGLEGIFCREKETCRVVLSVAILGRSAAVEVDASMIVLVQPSRSTDPQISEQRLAWLPEAPGLPAKGHKKLPVLQQPARTTYVSRLLRIS